MTHDAAPDSSAGGEHRPPGIVDHQFHWYPRSCIEALVGRATYPIVEKSPDGYVFTADRGVVQPAMSALTLDIDEQVARAVAAGVESVVVGPATLAEVLHLPAQEAADLLDALHEQYGAAQRAHPDRVVCLAALPMQDPALALAVLDRAVQEHGLRGVSLLTTNDAVPLVSDESLAVFRRIAELGLPVFLHPGLRSSTRTSTHTFREEVGLSWMYQTALAVLQLIDSGVLDAVPGLTTVHPHLGGVLPYVAGRISPLPGGKAEHPLEHYLRNRFYVDTAAATPAALDVAIKTYGPEHVLFASDYPFLPIEKLRRYVESNLSDDVVARIYGNRVPGLFAGGLMEGGTRVAVDPPAPGHGQ